MYAFTAAAVAPAASVRLLTRSLPRPLCAGAADNGPEPARTGE